MRLVAKSAATAAAITPPSLKFPNSSHWFGSQLHTHSSFFSLFSPLCRTRPMSQFPRSHSLGFSSSAAPESSWSNDAVPNPKQQNQQKEKQNKPWLIVGLDNPAKRYNSTRYNVEFQMVDAIADAEGISMGSMSIKALFGKGCLGNTEAGFRSTDNGGRGGSRKDTYQGYANLGMNLGLMACKNPVSAPYALCFRSFIHSGGDRQDGTGRDSIPMDLSNGERGLGSRWGPNPRSSFPVRGDFGTRQNYRPFDFTAGQKDFETGRNYGPLSRVEGVLRRDSYQLSRSTVEQDADFVVIKLLRNNTFVSVMDSKGNKKVGMTAGRLQKQQGGGQLSRYSSEATAEYVGRAARELGLKSFVIKVNGFMYFRKKRQAIMSFKEGFTQSRSGDNPIVYIEDTTRLPHNGCRLPRKRRI